MKTTLVIDDVVMERLKNRAASEDRTLSELVEAALRAFLEQRERRAKSLPPLPKLHTGCARVDVANRDALYDLMDDSHR